MQTNPVDPAVTVSTDYVVEITDDGSASDAEEAEVLILPPSTPGKNGLSSLDRSKGEQSA